jgi:hypothetical protein
MHENILSENLEGRHNFQHLAINGRIILKWVLNKYKGLDWNHLTLNKVQWYALVNTAMDIKVPRKRRIC